MRHFEISDWADYARGLLDAARRAAMDRHLAEGCRKCTRTAAVFGRLAPMAAAESRYAVPEHAVHCARAISVLEQPREVIVLSRFLGRQVFDSFLEPLPAGVRSQQRISRQTLYEAGDYTVDLRQEYERGASRIAIVGQVTSRREPGRALPGLQVSLSSAKIVLARATSNRFGEFQMEYAPAARGLRLDIAAGETQQHRGALEQPGIGGGLA